MGSLEHAKKSIVVFKGCVYKVPNENICSNLLKLGGDVSFGLALFGGRRRGSGGRLGCGRCRGLA